MQLNRSHVAIAAIVLILLLATTVGGLAWTIAESVYASDFSKCQAQVVNCTTEVVDESGYEIITSVEVLCKTPADEEFYAQFVGDLSRCQIGQTFTAYYRQSDKTVVYPRSSDLGFALIMLFGGLGSLAIYAVAIVGLYRSGAFLSNNYDSSDC